MLHSKFLISSIFDKLHEKSQVLNDDLLICQYVKKKKDICEIRDGLCYTN